ncbi:MAG: hypothetical protein CL814_17355 [Confluentimicrobium sp.]|uniref:CHAT domain-containing protein n=1 Tax=Actibacterium sp. TaxID=1872125 RepID=UPI000C3AD518|nr:CHAT domain-containing protein [Actibacterium sp.]MBC58688.1 hypothetical protein [Actibacterium sp.]
MRARAAVLAAALLCFALPLRCGAEPQAALQGGLDATVAALSEGRTDDAIALARETLELARRHPAPDPQLFAYALNNLAYGLQLSGQAGQGSGVLYQEALEHLAARGQDVSPAALTVTANLAGLEAVAGRPEVGGQRLIRFLTAAQGGPLEGAALGALSSFHFTEGGYDDAARYLEQMLAVEPALLNGMFGAVFQAYSTAQHAAEAEERHLDAVALIRGKISILRAFLPDETEAMRSYLQSIYFHYHQAGEYGRAAQAIRDWAAEAPLNDEDRAYVDETASLFLQAAQLSGYTERRDVQLDYTELAVAFAELLDGGADPRLGHALRERAAARENLGLTEEATADLQKALAVLAQSDEGRQSLFLVLSDLASLSWLTGDYGRAEDLYAQADAAYARALALGAAPLTPIDLVIEGTNRASLAISLGRPEEALAMAAEARALFRRDSETQEQKWNTRYLAARIDSVEALAYSELGQNAAAEAAALSALKIARAALPAGHPDLALTLTNTADLLFVLGRREMAVRLAEEAVEINREALPETMPNAIETELKLVLFHLTAGNRAQAIEGLRRITERRKSPAYRAALPEASGDFEMLAWALLVEGDDDPAILDEAFTALQWTQITRSADALAMMEARLKLGDPEQAALLRRRQDLIEDHKSNRSRLLAGYAAGEGAQAIAALTRRNDELEAGLQQVDTALAALGLEGTGFGGVTPVSIAEVQRLLGPREALVTFLLPGLRADQVVGLEASSNMVVAITADGVSIAPVRETSRRALRARIGDFRCQVAVGEPGCAGGRAAGTRGAMVGLSSDDSEGGAEGFDLAGAHALYLDLFGGVEAALDGRDHLILVPPPDLLRLPFEALVTTARTPGTLADADWMVRRHAISVLPSVPSFRALRQGVRPAGVAAGHLLAVGDPAIGSAADADCGAMELAMLRSAPPTGSVMSGRAGRDGLLLADTAALRALPRLPDATCELRAIRRNFGAAPATVLLGAAATESAIKDMDAAGGLAAYDVIVFATHGLTAGESGARAPGLVLTPPDAASARDDGLLSAAEIAVLRLNSDLVVLSACNTAAGEAGDEDGLSGLARAFFHAGARSLLVTHWPVYSQAAVEISTGLFEERSRQPGISTAEALRGAVLRLLARARGDRIRAHPSYWAAFAVVGAG